MKNNYQLEMEKIIDRELKSGRVKKLLLHSCCAPCSSYVLEYLANFFIITIIYYNPNIEPKFEYEKRKQEQIRLINEASYKYKVTIIDVDYENEKFKDLIRNNSKLETELEGGNRCLECYYLRLKKCALVAKNNNFDYFTTTLTISPHKNSEVINKIGMGIEKELSISYLPADFKKKNGYGRSLELVKKYNLYRQDYCGCWYSKMQKEMRNERCEFQK